MYRIGTLAGRHLWRILDSFHDRHRAYRAASSSFWTGYHDGRYNY